MRDAVEKRDAKIAALGAQPSTTSCPSSLPRSEPVLFVRRGSAWELVHNGETHPSGLDFRRSFEVHKPIPLRTSFRGIDDIGGGRNLSVS
jgi:hypothetical protein